ncbi:hypothetical protein [Salinigranum halophilum]|uniref:hypothetical protein n=1 Tax=Salinigranum halophilum TaxID=2565931 RepID=UPI0010A79787|nr:hypothetical protein [Salinigranum halophilum]
MVRTHYFVANATPLDWSTGVFSRLVLVAMGPGTVVLAVLVSARISVLDDPLDDLSLQHHELGRGLLCRPRSGSHHVLRPPGGSSLPGARSENETYLPG